MWSGRKDGSDIVQFIFIGPDDNILFVRDDAESASWQEEEYGLTAMFPYKDEKLITRGQRIGFTDETGIFQAFEIRKVRNYEPDHYQEITAEHIVVSELTDEFINEMSFTNSPPNVALAAVLEGTQWEVGNVAVGDLATQAELRADIEALGLNGNVDLTKRPVVYAEKMKSAGYSEFSGDYATLYSQTYTWDVEQSNATVTLATLLMTPIKADGTVLSPAQMDDYMLDLYEAAETVSGLIAADTSGLIIHILQGEQISAMDTIAESAHDLSASWEACIVGEASSGDVSRGKVWQAVGVIRDNWNIYIMPRVVWSGSQITHRYLDIETYGGVYRGLRLSIDKNADEIGVTIDDTNVVTAMFGYGRNVESASGGNTGETTPLTFASVVWSETEDHPAKPAGQTYLVNPAALEAYGRGVSPNKRNRWSFYQNSNIDDPEILLQKTWESMKQDAQPNVTINCVVQDLYRLGYNDVPLRLHDLALVEIRPTGAVFQLEIVALTVDLLNPLESRPTIGKYIPNIIYINRETNEGKARHGGGGGKGQTEEEYELGEFETAIDYNKYQISLRATQYDMDDVSRRTAESQAQINIQHNSINSIVGGTGMTLDENGYAVVDENGNPIFNIGTHNNLFSRIQQERDRIVDIIAKTGIATETINAFDPTHSYAVGDKVLYDQKVYMFTSEHVGTEENPNPWDPDDVRAVDLQSIVDTLESQVDIIQGSTLWRSESAITGVVGKFRIVNGQLQIVDANGIDVNDWESKLGFIKDGTLTAGYLIQKINGDQTSASIKADKVYIDANKSTSIGSVLDIYNGSVWTKVQAVFGEAGNFVSINGGTVKAPTIQVNSGGNLVFGGSASPDSPVPSVTITRADAARIMGMSNVSASVANNILTITDASGTTVNFSKATALNTGTVVADGETKQAGWSRGVFTVIATQVNKNTTTNTNETNEVGRTTTSLTIPAGHWGNPTQTPTEDVNTYYQGISATIGSEATVYDTGSSIQVDATGRYRAGSASVGLKTPEWLDSTDSDHPNTYFISTDGRVNSSTGATNEAQAYITPTEAIRLGKSQVGLKTPEWLDSTDDDHPNTYLISTNGRVNSSTGVTNEEQSYLTPTNAINYGKTLVTIDTITLGTITANASARTASVMVTATLDNGETKTQSVDVSTIYQAGLDGDAEITSAPFITRLVDTDDVFIKNRQKTVNVSAIYQRGVDDATPAVTRTYIYHSSGEKVHIYATASLPPTYVGYLYPNTPVSVGETTALGYIRITYDGISGYVTRSSLVTSTSTTPSPTLYPGQIGWVPEYPYTSYTFASSGDTVWIRTSASQSSSTVCAVPVGANISCMYDPNGYTDTWMPVQYGTKTGYMMSQFIFGTNEFYSHGGGSGMDDTYRYVTRVLSVNSASVPMYTSASTSSSVVTTVPHNSVIYCAENHVDYSGTWMRVKYGDNTGYMEAKYIRGTLACDQEQEDAAERLDIFVSGIYYTGSASGVINSANLWVYYTYTNSGYDAFVLKGSKAACNATDTSYNANSNMIRAVESDDERLNGETVHVVFNDGSEVEKIVVLAV